VGLCAAWICTWMFSWCSWLSHKSNTLKVSGSNPGENSCSFFFSISFFFQKTHKYFCHTEQIDTEMRTKS